MTHGAAMPDALHPDSEPFRTHRLPVGGGHALYVEECGRPDGVPVVFLHGGPGSGCSPAHRRFFDPARWRAVLFDQRGCGRSTPQGEVHANTTAHLVADIECIRDALGIERWTVFGGSWGSLLGLAYATTYPERVSGLVLRGIFLGADDEVRRYVQGAGQYAPDAWERFSAAMPVDERADLLRAYTTRLLAGDMPAARHWLDYERALMGEAPLSAEPDARQRAKVRVQAHYLAHRCFSDPAELLLRCSRLHHLPSAIVQGERDPVCPPDAAVRLHRALPHAQWVTVDNGGHNALAPDMAAACIAALDHIARLQKIASPDCMES